MNKTWSSVSIICPCHFRKPQVKKPCFLPTKIIFIEVHFGSENFWVWKKFGVVRQCKEEMMKCNLRWFLKRAQRIGANTLHGNMNNDHRKIKSLEDGQKKKSQISKKNDSQTMKTAPTWSENCQETSVCSLVSYSHLKRWDQWPFF